MKILMFINQFTIRLTIDSIMHENPENLDEN